MRLIGSFCVYRPPLNSLWGARELLWVPLGRHWAPLGASGTRLGSFCPSLVLPLALFGMPWGALGLPLAPFGPPWGPLWLLAGKSLKIGPPGGPKVDFLIDVCSGIGGLEFIPGIPRSSAESPESRGIPGSGPRLKGWSLKRIPSL